MTDNNSQEPRPGAIRRLFKWFRTPIGAVSLGFALVVSFVVGVVFWGGFHWAMEMTNTEKFCVSCHEMKDNVYAEYQGTVHQNNSSGVRATCPDCHVPKEWGPKVIRKIQASKELYGHFITGVIDTPEKFEDHRLYLASRVWTAMKETDSRECRNCHKFDYMDFTQQENRAAENHQKALDTGKTCIDCHQGIAHKLPEGYLDAYKKVSDDH
ncbi:cytochrome c-type protein NapC [Shimia gijangensis]|uniref:Cytochrome c-type protein n=1 Tax=Shimia gijangensis TaxID=1470563 RepID=A0A1M6JUB9_9RHOB|nr:NapC/NirT family cytochrome c [Shimia gijangensis]SHJ50259.1 cytochrome c-type protein NapC [Shimia gijangensis]